MNKAEWHIMTTNIFFIDYAKDLLYTVVSASWLKLTSFCYVYFFFHVIVIIGVILSADALTMHTEHEFICIATTVLRTRHSDQLRR